MNSWKSMKQMYLENDIGLTTIGYGCNQTMEIRLYNHGHPAAGPDRCVIMQLNGVNLSSGSNHQVLEFLVQNFAFIYQMKKNKIEDEGLQKSGTSSQLPSQVQCNLATSNPFVVQ